MIAHGHNDKTPERNPTFLFQRVDSKTLISKTLTTGTANRYCQQVLPAGASKTLISKTLTTGTANRYCQQVLPAGASKALISKTLTTGTANRYCQQVLPAGVSKTLLVRRWQQAQPTGTANRYCQQVLVRRCSTVFSLAHVTRRAYLIRSISEISSCFSGPRPWHIEIRHRVKKTSTINLFGFEILKSKIRRSKLWKPTVHKSNQS